MVGRACAHLSSHNNVRQLAQYEIEGNHGWESAVPAFDQPSGHRAPTLSSALTDSC